MRIWWKIEVLKGTHSISVIFSDYSNTFNWCLTSVYAPNRRIERIEVWEEVTAVRGFWMDHGLFVEIFNVTRYATERSNNQKIARGMLEFSDFIENLELIDPPLEGVDSHGQNERLGEQHQE